ncbi:MAG: sulfatase-like hydrolase/transferase [Phycisphaera sp.]|nr:sulfatase-like hydrolase/transferase [Phycisphaera sp.]
MVRSMLVILLLFAATSHAAARPNIILVLIDDMGWSDFSCFGNPDARTPNIDRLASEGIAFEQFYVNSPICSPSRVALSTGQYPQRWRITSYLAHRKINDERGLAQWLDPRAPMLARELHKAGYATGHFGKWHMGGQRDVEEAPPITDYGFDESLTNFEGMGPKLLPLTQKPGKDGKVIEGRIWADAVRLGGPVTWMQRSKITGGFVDAALKFIDKQAAADKPFYVNVWPDDVHSPYFPPIDKWGPTKRDIYLGVLVEADRQLAALFDRVRNDPKLRDNTLILVCSDNGYEPGAGQAGVFKGCKTNLYEGGIRSPLIVWGPGVIDRKATGTRNTTSVFAAIDLAPSLLKLAKVEPKSDLGFDGEDMLDTLLGRAAASRSAAIFFSRPPDRKNYYGYKDLPDLAVREGRWKLLCDYDGARPELYDLNADPAESKNLADLQPDIVKDLTGRATAWYHRVTPTGQ